MKQIAHTHFASRAVLVFVSLVASMAQVSEASVQGRFIFYNNSAWDGDNPLPNVDDDSAIATDKTPLLPGDAATFANYTSYSKGINGVMIDIAGLPGVPTVADFQFTVGNNDTPAAWAIGPFPVSITTRPTPGISDSTRITLIWADLAVAKKWLEIRVLPTANTGLVSTDIFYVGNAVGDSGLGNTSLYAIVNEVDEQAALNNLTSPGQASITNPYDYSRNKTVDSTDEFIAYANPTTESTALRLLNQPVPEPTTLAIWGTLGGLGLIAARRRKRVA